MRIGSKRNWLRKMPHHVPGLRVQRQLEEYAGSSCYFLESKLAWSRSKADNLQSAGNSGASNLSKH